MTFDPTTAAPDDPFDPESATPDVGPTASDRLRVGVQFNPDETAKAAGLAHKRGMPVDTVLRNLREVELRDSVEKADILLRSSPVLREQFRTLVDLPRVAHDDVEPLSKVEAGVNAFKREFKATTRGFDATEIARDAELLNVIDRIEKGELIDDAAISQATPYASLFAGAGRQPVMLEARKKQLQTRLAERVADYQAATRALQNLPSTGSLSRFNRPDSQTFDDAFTDFMSAPIEITSQVFAGSAGALLPSLPAIVAGGVFGGAPGLAAATGVTSAGTEYVNALPGIFQKMNVDMNDTAAVRRAVASPEFAQEVRKAFVKAGVIGVTDAATAGVSGRRLARSTAGNLAAQTGVQMAGGAGGEIAGATAAGEPVSLPQVFAEMIGEVPGAVVDVASHAARRAVSDGREVSRAQTDADNLQELFARAAESKLRERSPDTFAEFVQRAAESTEGAPQSVWIDAAKLGEVLNQEQIEEFLPAAVEQLREIGGVGGVIEVPIGEFTARVAGTPLEQQLLPHLRTDPEALSQEEAIAQGDDAAVYLQQRADDIIQQANDAMALQDEVTTIKQTVFDQLNATQRFKPDVNEAYATLVGNFYTVQAQAAGVSPRELYERYPLRVQGVSPAGGVLSAPGGRSLRGLPSVVTVDGKARQFGAFEPAEQAAERAAEATGVPYRPVVDYVKVDPERATRIAQAFEDMKHDPENPEVKAAYAAMIQETLAQWQAIKDTGLKVEFITGDDPYGNPRNAILDVVENNHLWVYPTDAGFGGSESAGVDISGNPLLQIVPGEEISGKPVRANDIFRIVHDYFGHIKEGVGFRADGEENAWRIHSAMYSPLARKAMTTETRGQNSWVNFGPFAEQNRTASGADTQYAPQKIGLLPDWVVEEGATDEALGQADIGNDAARPMTGEPAAPPSVGYHFSKTERTSLDGRYFGTGLKGAERQRLGDPNADPRLKERVSLYVDTGNGVRPEAGVGSVAHEVPLGNLYDAKADPLKLAGGGANAFEAKVLDAGYDGYWVPDFTTTQGAAVILGPASRNVKATRVEAPLGSGQSRQQEVNPTVYSTEATPEAAQAKAEKLAAKPGWAGYEVTARGNDVVYRRVALAQGVDQTETPEFKRWFGDSKVVDSEGKPLMVYHGTSKSFGEFDVNAERNMMMFRDSQGFYFTNDPRDASAYTEDNATGDPADGANVMPVYLRMQNPLRVASGDIDNHPAYISPERRAKLEAQGYDGVDYADGREIVVFRPEQIKSAIGNRGTFDPADPSIVNQGPRGAFSPSQLTITLLEKADLSTFLHETGHFFLEVMADLASRPGALERAAQDFETTLAWFGVKGKDGAPAVDTWNAMTLDEKRPYHERWAESFEQYLFEGKAPSVEMRPLFARFRSWMIQTYKSLRDFMAGRNLRISDDIRQVFDRLIATDEEIAEAERRAEYEALFGSAAEAAMTPEQWEEYQAKSAASTQTATERLQSRSLMDMKWVARARAKALREAKAEVEEKRKAMEVAVREELAATPVERARAYIREQRVSTPEQRDALKDWSDRRAAAVERETEAVKAELLATPEGEAAKGLERGQLLAKNKRQMANEVERRVLAWEGEHPKPTPKLPDVDMDLLADRLGYDSADALRRDLTEQPQLAELVEPMTDQRLMETYGDLVTPQAVDRAANEAVHNEARQRFIATEMAALREMMSATKDSGKTTRTGKPLRVNVALAAAKSFADSLIARRKVIDVKPAAFRGAEKRAGRRAVELQAGGDTQGAYAAKRDQLLNGVASQKAEAALTEIDRKLDYLRKFDKEGPRKALSQDYLDQIDQLLERYDLRRSTSARDIQRRASLAEWIAEQQEMGLTPAVPADLVADSRQISYKQLTVEEFRGLVDAVRSIEHLGRLKNKLLRAKDAREFGIIAQEIADAIRESKPAREVKLEGMGGFEKFARGFAAEHRKLASLIYQMDGGKDDGPFYRAFTRTMNEAGVEEAVRNEASTIALSRIFAPMTRLPGGLTGRKSRVFIPEIKASLSRGGRLAVALNWGNAGNRQRLLDGDGWTEAQALAIIRTLSPAELKFVNDVWEHIDSYWPDIKAKQERVTGVVEDKVTAEPFELQLGDGSAMQMRGGYYPIKYDSERSAEAEKNETKETITQMLRGAMMRPTTRRGHTEARVQKVVGRPVRKNLNTITQHVHQVNHDLAWHEWFVDANRLMNDKRISSAIREHYGPQVAKTMKDDMEAIAAGQLGGETTVDAALLHLRNNVSRSVMGLSFTTALLQPFGLTQSIARIGVGPVLKGAVRWAGEAARLENSMEWIGEKSDFMRLRSKTFNREIREISHKINGKSKATEIVDAGLFFMMRKMQAIADIPTWVGMYEKAIEDGKPEDAAVALADQAVLAAQGGGEIKDLAAIQRKHPMLTQFYSYFSTTLNLTAESTAKTDFKNPRAVAGWLGDMALLLVVPAILPSLLIYLLRGGADDDDAEDIGKKLLEWQASYALGLVVGLRELTGAVAGFDYAGPPAGRVVSDITKATKQIGQGEVDEPLVKSVINLLGSAFGVPTAQAMRMWNGWEAWAEGDAPPTAILLGPPPKD